MTRYEVILVHLRQPQTRRTMHKNCLSMRSNHDHRDDPFWEIGSFGITGCHKSNIMNQKTISMLKDKRIGFVQGGKAGMKLIYLTPKVHILRDMEPCEMRWKNHRMPFKYTKAPLLIDNDGKSDFLWVKEYIKNVNRRTWVAKFSSKFRARKAPIEEELAHNLVELFDTKYKKASNSEISAFYYESMPYAPSVIDEDRKERYRLLRHLTNNRPASYK